MQKLLRDLNGLYREHSALHQLDCEAHGFEWLVSDDADNSVFAWMRRDEHGNEIIVACNFTPVPRVDYRVGLASNHTQWREVLNTDSHDYGGSDVGNSDRVMMTEAVSSHGRTHSLLLTLPPLATVFFIPVN
jgi:1,4-alpha-glucan branching enzyme